MSNASLKEQLEAVVSKISNKKEKPVSSKKFTKPRVAPLEKPKPKWLDYAQYGVELLKVYFPTCFKPMKEIKPLKKGIKEDLLKALSANSEIVTADKACMVKSLSFYVNTLSYLRCVIEGAVRIDLAGQPAGVVSSEEAKYSLERLNIKLQAKNKTSGSADKIENNN